MHSTQIQQITSRHNELFHGPLWRPKQTERQSFPPFLIRQGLKNIKALFTSLSLELTEMEFWPAFVWFWPTVQSKQTGNSHFRALKTSRRGNGTAWRGSVVHNARLPTRSPTSTAEAWHSSEGININSDASWTPTCGTCACGTYTGCPGRNVKKLRESIPYVKIYRYNPKHLYPKLNGYGDNSQRKVGVSVVSTHCKLPADSPKACPSFRKVSYYILNCIPSGW
jgi:hypothetical protein